jgi:hypothetical protein
VQVAAEASPRKLHSSTRVVRIQEGVIYQPGIADHQVIDRRRAPMITETNAFHPTTKAAVAEALAFIAARIARWG